MIKLSLSWTKIIIKSFSEHKYLFGAKKGIKTEHNSQLKRIKWQQLKYFCSMLPPKFGLTIN